MFTVLFGSMDVDVGVACKIYRVGRHREPTNMITGCFLCIFFLMKLLQVRLMLLAVLTSNLSAVLLKTENFQVLIPSHFWAGYDRVLAGASPLLVRFLLLFVLRQGLTT